ncbi:hypothetical protein [Marilutibacter alkalisoli]|uniref:Lipoprotein n=1 Tax=Marilutibacter alkalisoli TaxID=2591633 RepID=A0A514BVR6_9GAMM|nr:hypothetical protein [Lysobacter alkalisoli]QDH71501.1 hypothetical protein FKV23_16430 [Lysobacter alkalisoli]
MTRTLLIRVLAPALAVTLLGGCVSGYNYRADGGGYYYGRPSVQYQYYGGYGYYPYSLHPYGVYSYGHYPYRYYRPHRPYYSYPRYPYYPVYPHRPPVSGKPPSHRPGDGHGKAPWRDLDRIEREKRRPRLDTPAPRQVGQQVGPTPSAQPRPVQPRATYQPRPRSTERQDAKRIREIEP